MSMEDFVSREDDRALNEFMKNMLPRKRGVEKRKGIVFERLKPGYVELVLGNLTVKEWMGFHVFECGEVAALGELSIESCPYEGRISKVRMIWLRGWKYGRKRGVA